MSFPVNPTNGQLATVNGIRYTYNGTTNSWVRIPLAKFTAAASNPPNPGPGDQWYNTTKDILYTWINDGTNSYWVDIESPTVGTATGDAATFYGNLYPYSGLGNIFVTGNLQPTSNNTYTLGSLTSFLNNAYITNISTTKGVYWGNGAPFGVQITTSTTPPANPKPGDQWYNSTTDVLYEYLFDGTNSNWIDIESPFVGTVTFTGNVVANTFIPLNTTVNIGSPSNYFGNSYISSGYFGNQTISGNLNIAGTIIGGNIIAGGARSTSSLSTNPPTAPSVGDIWYQTDTDIKYRYTYDGTNTYWVDYDSTVISATVYPSVLLANDIVPSISGLYNVGQSYSYLKGTYSLTNYVGTIQTLPTQAYVTFSNTVTPVTGGTAGGIDLGTRATPFGNIYAGGVMSTTSLTPPANPVVGDVWYNSLTDIKYRYTFDGTSSYWVDYDSTVTGATYYSANLVISDISPSQNVTFSLGNVTSYFANSFVSNSYVANNQVIGNNLTVAGNIVAGNIVAGGVRSTTSATAPTNPTVGDIWYNTTNDIKYRYTFDGTSNYWVDYDSQVISATYFSGNILGTDLIPQTGVPVNLGSQTNAFNAAYASTVYTKLIIYLASLTQH